MNRSLLLLSSLIMPLFSVVNQTYAQFQNRPNGMTSAAPRTHALVGATLISAPGQRVENATIVLRDGGVLSVEPNGEVPPGAVVHDLTGQVVAPGFIDPSVLVEAEIGDAAGSHWNRLVHPEFDFTSSALPLDSGKRSAHRRAGFTLVAVQPSKGIFRGTGTLLATTKEDGLATGSWSWETMQGMGFDRGGSWGLEGYPVSLMGSIALARQTLMDATHHQAAHERWMTKSTAGPRPPQSDAMVALAPILSSGQPVLFDTKDEVNAARAHALAEEFGLDLVMLGSGNEFRRMDDIVAMGREFVLPVDFPDAPVVRNAEEADSLSLRDLMTWEEAPSNPARLRDAGVVFSLTAHGLSKPTDIHDRIRQAIRRGLSPTDAMAALTTIPAQLLGINSWAGTVVPGHMANLVVFDGEPFEKGTSVQTVWVGGVEHVVQEPPVEPFRNQGTLQLTDGQQMSCSFDRQAKKITFTKDDTAFATKKVEVDGELIGGSVDAALMEHRGWATFRAVLIEDRLTGAFVATDGHRVGFEGVLSEPMAEAKASEKETEATDDEQMLGPDPVSGLWTCTLSIPDQGFEMSIDAELTLQADGGITGSMSMMDQEVPLSSGSFDAEASTIELRTSTPGGEGVLSGTIADGILSGSIESPMGSLPVEGTRVVSRAGGESDTPTDEDDVELASELPEPNRDLPVPLGGYGRFKPPVTESVLLTNAVIWTASDAGILEDAWMLVERGKITDLGAGRPPETLARVVDATGLHITPGLIDCHSHTGINGGVNEGSRASTAEVTIEDVVNPDDVDWYRQLAGGLTAANQLHGSANPIGGRNSVVKLKWGGDAQDFRMQDAKPGIKFALGENVKRSRGRYPDTRMGVAAFMRDRFDQAEFYRSMHERWDAMGEDERALEIPPRFDLELQTLVEILEGDRIVHCHSYRQDEILALLRLGEEKGFRIGTLQHILEGYKVADAIAEHGAGASSFSDWWTYKVEVMDAIPWNGWIMHEVGVNVSFNSDSNELARRMHGEAAKAVKYGGIEPHEALKFITLNPAKQLGIDHRTGSLEVGKDADFTVWNRDPLSSYALVQETWIEGACYFSREKDAEVRKRDRDERSRLLGKLLVKQLGEAPMPPPVEPPPSNEPADPRGVCGCTD